MAATSLILLLSATLAAAGNSTGFFDKVSKGITKEIVAVKEPIESTVVSVASSGCSGVKKLIGVSYEQLDGEKEPDVNTLKLEYRDESVRIIFNISTAADKIISDPGYNPHKKLIIFIHGFTDNPTKSAFTTISEALLKTGEVNVLALDGSSLIKWLYLRSSTYVRFMGEKLGEVLAAMVKKGGVRAENIHVIGHSLGAHISGFTGKTFTNLTGTKVGRISGLDPAGPCFSHVDDELKLKDSDAAFMDVIHSDAGVYGLEQSVGHIDFWPNSGSQQPNCLQQSCSHSRAWQYYAESVVNNTAFPAVRCKSWDYFKKGRCESGVLYMGYPAKFGTTGDYYLQTGDEEPYGLGKKGLEFTNNQGIINNISDKTKSIFG